MKLNLLDEAEYKARQEKWDRRFLSMSRLIASWSKDPSTQTGAVIVTPRGAGVSWGYNGLPMCVEDTPERLNNRDLKYKMIVHCERNALIFAEKSLMGCILYTWPFMSCAVCAGMVIQAGIAECVAPSFDGIDPALLGRWKPDFDLTMQMLSEAGVKLRLVKYPLKQPVIIEQEEIPLPPRTPPGPPSPPPPPPGNKVG